MASKLCGVLVFILSVLVVVLGLFFALLDRGGVFLELHPHGQEGCKKLGVAEGVVGAEDVMLDSHLLYISSDPRHLYMQFVFYAKFTSIKVLIVCK